MKLCAGGCGRAAIEGGIYHCRKGGDGYNACKQRAHRQRNPGEDQAGNTGNVTQNTGEIMAELHGLREENAYLRQKLDAQSDQIAALREENAELKQLIREYFTQPAPAGPRAIADSNQPLPGPSDHDDLADLLEVKQANGGSGQSSQNFIDSMLAMQGIKSAWAN